MAAGGPVHIVVDITGLLVLRDRLGELRTDLDEVSHVDVWSDQWSVGDAGVSDAIEKFVSGWRDGRARIDEKLDRCLKLLDLAVSTYREANRTLVEATTPRVEGE
ncbi:MAG TPA: hypothetical protein VFM54_00560 [Micromonosporaceae bacterium]|nr:hypothetical protein [Micromonosporaceae bacterium]